MFYCLNFSRPGRPRLWIRKSIGEGSFSTVFEAKDVRGRLYAVKSLKFRKKIKESKNSKVVINYRIDVYNEIMYQVSAIHHNVLKVLDVYIRYKRAWIVLEFCSLSLTDIFPKKKISIHNTNFGLYLLFPILDAISHIHSIGIIHRDVKLGNILICGNRPVLADFGLAIKSEGEETYKGDFGSRDYISPELVRRESYNFSVDTWAWAITFLKIYNAREHKNSFMEEVYYSYETQTFGDPEEERVDRETFYDHMNISKNDDPPKWQLPYYDLIYPFVVLNKTKRPNAKELCTWVKRWKAEQNFSTELPKKLLSLALKRWERSQKRKKQFWKGFKIF